MEDVVWRVRWAGTPLDFIPRENCSWQNRFDDVHRGYRTLHVAHEQVTCLREVLADLRPNTKALADFQELFGGSAHLIAGEVSWEFREKRVLAPARIQILEGELVDIDDVAVLQGLERRHAALLYQYGMDHLNIGEIRSEVRVVTQTISGTLYDERAAGIRFRSKLDDLPCIALFEGRAILSPAGNPEPLTNPIPALLQVRDEYNLVLRQQK